MPGAGAQPPYRPPSPFQEAAAPPAADLDLQPYPPPERPRRGRRAVRVTLVVLLVLALVGASGATAYLYRTATAWEERSDAYLDASFELGAELAASREELAGTQAELDAVRAQLATAHQRIVELADEKAQLGDDREAQLQVVDYQERVTEAAGRVAHALDQCVQGQDRLIGYLRNADAYDPVELDRYGQDVQALCRTATDANAALQRELAR